ncbi:conserved hypothetical protein, partial [Ricinus communis]
MPPAATRAAGISSCMHCTAWYAWPRPSSCRRCGWMWTWRPAISASRRTAIAIPESPHEAGHHHRRRAVHHPVRHRAVAIGEEALHDLVERAHRRDGQHRLAGALRRRAAAAGEDQEGQAG